MQTRDQLVRLSSRFHTKKHLGQNFLVDPEQLDRIAAALDLSSADQVLEIGPGLGFLTEHLVATGAAVTAVELDADAVRYLEELKLSRLKLVQGDFLRYDLSQLIGSLPEGQNLKVAGNVPYQITSKIIAYLFGEIDRPSPWLAGLGPLVFTVQLEVARRFVAKPGEEDYSQISILTSYYSTATLLDVVPADSFYPVPQVNSAVVLFTPRVVPAVTCNNMKLMRQIIQAGFRQRRKMLRNNLSFLPVSAQEISSVFARLHLDPQTRAERLSLQQFALLADTFDALMQANGSTTAQSGAALHNE